MNFVELVLTVCTLAQPVACDEPETCVFSESGSLHGCMMQAQPLIAQCQAIIRRCAWCAGGASSGLGRR